MQRGVYLAPYRQRRTIFNQINTLNEQTKRTAASLYTDRSRIDPIFSTRPISTLAGGRRRMVYGQADGWKESWTPHKRYKG